MNKYFFPFFFLFTLFSEEIFCSYLSVQGTIVESGMLQKIYVVIAPISYMILARDISKGHYGKRETQFLGILMGLLLLLLITFVFYSNVPSHFVTSILHFSGVCVPASICGMHLASNHSWKEVDTLLPYFLGFIGLAVGVFGIRTLLVSLTVDAESSLDYQNVSYFMAEVFSYSAYCVFFSSLRFSSRFTIVRLALFFLMAFSSVVVMISGGRGGFLYLCVSIFVLIVLLAKTNRLSRFKLVLIIMICLTLFIVLASNFSIFESSGFSRITTSLTDDDSRKELYSLAWQSFENSPLIGHGLGSVWMEVGFYCHNLVLDLLVEVGLLGLAIYLILYIKTGLKLWIWMRYNAFCILIFIAMLKVTVMTMFSGYWLNALQLWLVFGFVYIASCKRYRFVSNLV